MEVTGEPYPAIHTAYDFNKSVTSSNEDVFADNGGSLAQFAPGWIDSALDKTAQAVEVVNAVWDVSLTVIDRTTRVGFSALAVAATCAAKEAITASRTSGRIGVDPIAFSFGLAFGGLAVGSIGHAIR